MRLLSAASDPCPASSQNTRTHHVATSNRAAVACISRTHDQPQTHAHTTRQSDTPITLHSIRGPAAPHSLLSAALTWTSLSSSLYNHHHKNTRHTHTDTSRLFCPSATSLLSSLLALILSSALHSPCCSAKPPNKPTYCHYSAFSIVSMYTLLLLLSFVVSFSRREPPPPLTTSASPPSPPQTSASPPSPPPPP